MEIDGKAGCASRDRRFGINGIEFGYHRPRTRPSNPTSVARKGPSVAPCAIKSIGIHRTPSTVVNLHRRPSRILHVFQSFKLTRSSSPISSTIPRPRQAVRAVPPRGSAAGNQDSLQPEVDVDGLDAPHLLGHEPDAAVRHCLFRQLGSPILAANGHGE